MEKREADKWKPFFKKMTKEGIQISFMNNLHDTLAKDQYTATEYDNFVAVAIAIRDRLVERWIMTQQRYHRENVKRVYYLSLEFLIGRLLATNVINLDLWDKVKDALNELDIDIEEICDQEHDAGLGNGGLGRLAACFLDSMATLGIAAHGYGIRYDYGIFRQKISSGYQLESPDEWLQKGNPWEFARPEYQVKIRFYGRVENFYDKNGRQRTAWKDTYDVLAMPYDIPVSGYKNDVVNTLRLWSARSTEEFDFDYFNHGDYEKAVSDKMLSENISKVLYPNDSVVAGQELRLKQEYFFTAASISDIIRRFKAENNDLSLLPDKVTIQLNDTHPSLAILELMRILVDEENMDWDKAWDITVKVFAYTNHTILPEALEKWPVTVFEHLLPRHLQIIYEINLRFLRSVLNKFIGDNDRLTRMSIIEEGGPKKIRMAHLAIVGSHSVNGVSQLHSELLKTHLFRDFYEFCPEKFKSITNGVTQRRWLKASNIRLSDLITSAIGDGWVTNLYELEKLMPLVKDNAFRKKWQEIKNQNKQDLSKYIHKTQGVLVEPNTLFDVQVKRIHEYKRQLLFAFYIIAEYLKLKQETVSLKYSVPRTFIIGGKAAPGYYMAKLIIKFINNVADVINNDKTIEDKIKVVFVENYGVSIAEKIFPASDLSEQISTAGYEASGTGCMKFMMNGALTIGTLDGANIEIAQAVGKDNLFIFGANASEIDCLKETGYNPQDYISKSTMLQKILYIVEHDFFSPTEPGLFDPLIKNIMHFDPYFICLDFESYLNVQETISELYSDQDSWTKKSIINVAKSGIFSSDRTIADYAKEIWDVPIVNGKKGWFKG